jgi:hypothetical protein
MVSLSTIPKADVLIYDKVAREAYKSPEIRGDLYRAMTSEERKSVEAQTYYGRANILQDLVNILTDINPDDSYLGSLLYALGIVGATVSTHDTAGNNITNDLISDLALRSTIERQILDPFFEEYKRTGNVSPAKLEKIIALWLRDRDAEVRWNLKKYTANLDKFPINKQSEFMILLDENQLRYTTGIVRRMSNLLKAKYPDKVSEMDTIYNQVTTGNNDINTIAEGVLNRLEKEEEKHTGSIPSLV